MSKPAARIGDMHVCPMVTPGTPPIPHVGGPVTGPGVPTVLIGGMPAAVMGDMCVCTGPPDSIVLGSTGVLIGNKPAARLGDMCAHGGSIVAGCPTVLIGEVGSGGAGMAQAKNVLNKISVERGEAVALVKAQEASLLTAAAEGIAFCEVCGPSIKNDEGEADNTTAGPAKVKNPRITNLVWMKGDQIIDGSKAGKDVKVRAQVMDIDDGEELTFTISDPTVVGDETGAIELKGIVKDGYAEVDWVVEDPYTDEEEDL